MCVLANKGRGYHGSSFGATGDILCVAFLYRSVELALDKHDVLISKINK